MEKKMVAVLSESFRQGLLNRRDFIQKVVLSAGGTFAASHVLGRLGFEPELVREARAQGQQIVTIDVTYPSGNDMVNAYLAKPAGDGPFPTMIVIHEIYGLSAFARDVARLFARSGFVALAPELIAPPGEALPDGRHAQWMLDTLATGVARVPEPELVKLRDAYAWLSRRPDVDAGHIGSVGFCWGGARSFSLATLEPKLWVAVVFYGTTPPLEDLGAINAPVLGLYGALDNSSPTSITGRAAETAREMMARSKPFEWEIYNRAPHGFFREGAGSDPTAHVAETRPANIARDLMFDFLDRHYG